MLAHRIPYPPHTGDKTRAFHIARHLSARHDLTLGFLVDDERDLGGIDALRRIVPDLVFERLRKPVSLARGITGLARGGTVTLPYFYSARLARQIRRRSGEARFDVVYASSTAMAQYAPGDVPLVMDFVDVDSDKWRQYAEHRPAPFSWLYRAEGRRLQSCEGEIARRARVCLLATDVEEGQLRSFAPWAHTAVIPNGIDSGYYSPRLEEPSEPAGVIFTGAMDYLPNIDAVQHFCADILPLVRRDVPDAVFYIVGLNPSADVRRLGEQPGVVVTGSVPDVRPYYARTTVCVAPLRIGRGIQNKVLQGMAMGLPVVASPLAARGVRAEPGVHYEVAEAPEMFARHVARLLQCPEARRALGRAGRACIEAHYTWEHNLAGLEALLSQAAGRPASTDQVTCEPPDEARAWTSRP
ncbi:MAG TPA: TIGR03087 family PEP-CTERM/XrtA system glycosyltransferase [Methylomirabilota bacterium]|jgi:sugar transferase (PEP-CTERM/EpsH1 system associated)